MKPQLTKEAFAEFCESKPADEEYVYHLGDRCACAQFSDAVGGDYEATHECLFENPFWRVADEAAVERPRTFGALAARLRSS